MSFLPTTPKSTGDSTYGSPGDVFLAEDGSISETFAQGILQLAGATGSEPDGRFRPNFVETHGIGSGNQSRNQRSEKSKLKQGGARQAMEPDSGIICDPVEEDHNQVNHISTSTSLTPSLDLRRLQITDFYFTPLTSPALPPVMENTWVPPVSSPLLASGILGLSSTPSVTFAGNFEAPLDPEYVSLQKIQEQRSRHQQLLAQLQRENERLQEEEMAILQRLGQKQAEQLSNGEQLLQHITASNNIALVQQLSQQPQIMTSVDAGSSQMQIDPIDGANQNNSRDSFSHVGIPMFQQALNATTEAIPLSAINSMAFVPTPLRSPRMQPSLHGVRGRGSSLGSPPNPFPTSQPSSPQIVPAKRKTPSDGASFSHQPISRTSSRVSLNRSIVDSATVSTTLGLASPRGPAGETTVEAPNPSLTLPIAASNFAGEQIADPRALVGMQIYRAGSPFKVPLTPASILRQQEIGGQPVPPSNQQLQPSSSPRFQPQSHAQSLSTVPAFQQPESFLPTAAPLVFTPVPRNLARARSQSQFQKSPRHQPVLFHISPQLRPTRSEPAPASGNTQQHMIVSSESMNPTSDVDNKAPHFQSSIVPATPSTLMNFSHELQGEDTELASAGSNGDSQQKQRFVISDGVFDVGLLPLSDGGPSGDVRKVTHKVAEQRRRDSLRDCFERLKDALPSESLAGEKNPSKVYILRKSEHIVLVEQLTYELIDNYSILSPRLHHTFADSRN
ncbi:hypothetical protein M427DRAFT_429578 [Gonapodya prolifera JEL478]|uniref:BHLH domain-containing protein n=1 Tax=Gonapodya prolifera (strain JEL478) TaxID=1344416 RepID=A0A139AT79_GONPJ|nr:hypothetical protein M427DRAFT_429578 [Gonapodya prolifera JEL478]|eukprot:KXS19773.1 hypothetical protein M427DRAFT_429578 [Gonapodya prolifera JEL478]